MSVAADVLRFLRDPASFASEVAPGAQSIHGASLGGIVDPAIARSNGAALRDAQVEAYEGLGRLRAGLLLGPPGTGKTHLSSWLVLGHLWARMQAGLAARAFLTAFTRSALETLLAGVAERAGAGPALPTLVYVGSPRSPLPPDVKVLRSVQRDGDDLRDLLQEPNVVLATTVWGLNAAIVGGIFPTSDGPTTPYFDLVAIDEASQMVVGQGLMALAGMAEGCRVVVAGDDRQLPPIRSARGMVVDGREIGSSLYALLKTGGVPEFALKETFRLNEQLTSFPERRFYPSIYVSAVPDRRLSVLPDWMDGLDDLERFVLDPSRSTVVLVHDGPSAATQSPFELELATRLVNKLRGRMSTKAGRRFGPAEFWRDGMALISPHRAQNAALRARIDPAERDLAFVDTVDRIQGRERDAVIMTYTVSDTEFALAEAEFIFSPERLNVAITRARSKLVVIVSRRLLEVLPPRQEDVDRAAVLYEFVFSVPPVWRGDVSLVGSHPVGITVRAQGDGDAGALAFQPPPALVVDVKEELLDPRADALLEAIRRLCREKGRTNVSLWALKQAVPFGGGLPGAFGEVLRLHRSGHVRLQQWPDRNAPGQHYWMVAPTDHRRHVVKLDDPSIEARIRDDVYRDRMPYAAVRDRYDWIAGPFPGADLLLPIVEGIVAGGALLSSRSEKGALLLSPVHGEVDPPSPPTPEAGPGTGLEDGDFEVLNALEDIEVERIGVGLVEIWSEAKDLRRLGTPEVIAPSLKRLAAAGHILIAAEGRLRSRMAELARELRYVKQRFRPDDAARRPFLVRSLKVLLRDRTKPRQDRPLRDVLQDVKHRYAGAEVHRTLDGLGDALSAMWGGNPRLAGFQERSFASIFASWFGNGGDAFVIAADTGSGKTEAAMLPLIAGACVDRLRGIDGTRAILAYPRVRLAANQSQRLARYLAGLARMPGMPTLTLGVQFADVPTSWRMRPEEAAKAEKVGWSSLGDGAWRFPFFACPVPTCGDPLELQVGQGVDGADRLVCRECGWRYNGWVGTKQGLRERPPTFFLPTMDSLHQWLQTPRYGGLFGDGGQAPRAFMADEIHLYAYTHGAQVAYAMRRLLARCGSNDPSGRRCVAIGMSATLGDPAEAFGRLVGRDGVIALGPREGESPINSRGREYFFFIQPEVESRDHDVAGASTTIQCLMCLAHGMRRRTGREGGFRTIAFLDSIDKVRRLHSAFDDAEGHHVLSGLRTRRYGDNLVTGRPMQKCCGDPASCDRFADGECWYFAATDDRQVRAGGAPWRPGRALAVARSPVSSKTEGAVEKMIKESDVVFATSSLEVGYDDPDIALVYQHYGPQNLASFIQRKGRGGRGADDRPLTAVTLSLYKPRDVYWFDRPDLMLDAKGFRAPLNPGNHFVRRAQILSAFLDAMAADEARSGRSPWRSDGVLSPDAIAEASRHVEAVFGARPWEAYRFDSMAGLWRAAVAARAASRPVHDARDARDALPWLPVFLHDTIDMPTVEVRLPAPSRPVDEDVQLAFSMLAPGNVSRRFHPSVGAWRPPVRGRGPWFAREDYDLGRTIVCSASLERLLEELPTQVVASLGHELAAEAFQPLQVSLLAAGGFSTQWASWTPAFEIDEHHVVSPSGGAGAHAAPIAHESVGFLTGCMVVDAAEGVAETLSPPAGQLHVTGIECFTSGPAGGGSSLKVSHVAWGAEAVLRTTLPGAEPISIDQIFTHPVTGKALLHGFQVETEGVRVAFDEGRLRAFVESEVSTSDLAAGRWTRLHMARCLTALRLQDAGVGRFEAERVAVLLGAVATLPRYEDAVRKLKRLFRSGDLAAMMREVGDGHLVCDPLLTHARVEAAAGMVGDPDLGLGSVIQEVLRALDDPARRAEYILSALLNGLALRWRQIFVTTAQGDERRVSVHCKLPILYSEGPPVVTIAENGQSGDGTTRAFREAIAGVWRDWSAGFASRCPNAEEDGVVDRFFASRLRHNAWLGTDPRDGAALASIASALDVGSRLPASITRMLFDELVVGSETFRGYDVASALYDARASLEAGIGRWAMSWETVSAVTVAARDKRGASVLAELFEAYANVPDTDGEGSRSTTSRFAEQVYRLGARLCTDGCRACVQQDGGMIRGLAGESAVSRALIGRYLS